MLSPKVHGAIDYASVAGLAIAPTVLGLSGLAAMLAYALAAIHLAMTVLTSFPAGWFKVIPLRVHGAVELAVAVTFIVIPWLLSGSAALSPLGRTFFVGFGAVLFVVWLLTAYRPAGSAHA
jgi:hypothetical protein